MAGTYVQLSREEFEDWLDSDLKARSKWKIKDRTGGIYQVALSDNVGVEINSTTGNQSRVRGHGQASMKLRLVSLVDGTTLNKKSMGQSHFKRTINWRQTWKTGFDRVRATYLKTPSFYEKIADREGYKDRWIAIIESIPAWDQDRVLKGFHQKVEAGDVLWDNQEESILDMQSHPPTPAVTLPEVDEDAIWDQRLANLRKIYAAARRDRDQWTMDFIESLARLAKARRGLSARQSEILGEKAERYGVEL